MKTRFRCSVPHCLLCFSRSMSWPSRCAAVLKLDAGNGGRNTIQGDIIAPNGQRLDRPVMVRLRVTEVNSLRPRTGMAHFIFVSLRRRALYRDELMQVKHTKPASEVVDIPTSGLAAR